MCSDRRVQVLDKASPFGGSLPDVTGPQFRLVANDNLHDGCASQRPQADTSPAPATVAARVTKTAMRGSSGSSHQPSTNRSTLPTVKAV